MALEDSSGNAGKHAFKSGKAGMDTHSALPEDAVRHREIEALLGDYLKTDPSKIFVRAASFLALRHAEIGSGMHFSQTRNVLNRMVIYPRRLYFAAPSG